MVRENDMIDIADRIVRHVARHAVIAIGLPRCCLRPAIGRLVAREALAAEVCSLPGRCGERMRIVAGSAPHLTAAGSLARALGQVLSMAGYLAQLRGTGAHEYGHVVG